MIYTDITTSYIASNTNNRLVRYDVIRMSDDNYIVKVIDEQTKGIAEPKILIQIDELDVTRQSYHSEYNIGGVQTAIMANMPPSFEGYLQLKLQDHRNKLD